VRYNERVGQRWFHPKSRSHSLERSISTQHVSSIFRVETRFRLRGGDALIDLESRIVSQSLQTTKSFTT
jgi:hypothetical protein